MDYQKIKDFEPYFDGWYVDTLVREYENTAVYKVAKKTVEGGISYRLLKVISIQATREEGDENLYPARVQRILTELDIMQRMKNCDNVLEHYSHSVVDNGDGSYDILALIQNAAPLTEKYDIHDLSETDALKISVAMSHALEQFRSAGTIQRNINPENIFVDYKGDFRLGALGAENQLIIPEDYVSPEEYNVSGDLKNSDMYALGMLSFKLLNHNRAPFLPAFPIEITQENRNNALARRMNGEAIVFPDDSHGELAAALQKACAFTPADRYQNVASLRTELEKALSELDPSFAPAAA